MAMKIADLQTTNLLMNLEENQQTSILGGSGVLQDIYWDTDGDGDFDYHQVIGLQDDGRITDKIFRYPNHPSELALQVRNDTIYDITP